jgi:hypothetical protein
VPCRLSAALQQAWSCSHVACAGRERELQHDHNAPDAVRSMFTWCVCHHYCRVRQVSHVARASREHEKSHNDTAPDAMCFHASATIAAGPTGCGKSVTLHVLAESMGFELTEWNAPVPTLWQDYQYQVQLCHAMLCYAMQCYGLIGSMMVMSTRYSCAMLCYAVLWLDW